jgi:DNA primase
MSIITQIKAKLPIAPFVSPYTNGLRPSGNGFFIGRCPVHQSPDDPPRKLKFWVNPAQNICGCFVPRCPAHGKPLDIIGFYQLLHNCSPSEAIHQLARKAGL